ncbi:flavodoxin domain-containing protein [Carboxylicivirga mesophila]|uniref:Flavodoxin domain-containing protein n=1 Tax=Carboxylicivirga mesophila TaxID=1166478 RepID=A0ABS5KD80_9BACT|nr:flavodoxin domain-containing protein [Carboxylicivirga mesophila]MBS2212298.1 flavodoxin domain-containing protein [Carboxylicivirga mesophila]
MMNTFKDTIYILFGSRTGNSKAVAILAHEYAQSLGYASELRDMQDMDFNELQQMTYLLVAVSTHGEGEPPVQAEGFYEYIHGNTISQLNTRYAVLGLGDSSYRYFCQTGEDIDKRMQELGGQRLMEHVKCDIDFEETAKSWVLDVFKTLESQLKAVNPPQKEGFVFDLKLGHDSTSAYKAELLQKTMLTAEGSSKKVLHVSLSLKNAGMDYQPGDAIGVYGTNSRSLVDELLKQLDFDKAYPVVVKDQTRMLKELLIHDYELTLITPLVIRNYAEIVNNTALNELIVDDQQLEAYAEEKDVMDMVSDFPGPITVEEFLSVLRKLSQRLYSVASSSLVVGEQADITVKIIENRHDQRTRNGVCSSFLWNRLDVGDRVPVTLETISKFRLPETDTTPIIMIGAGTGVAPFRGFLQERFARKASGPNWLLFGERNSQTDFLYEEELKSYLHSGLLSKLNTAFSRDGEQKFYINQVVEQEGSEIMNWINKGAVIYVCGSKDKLAVSVRASLIKVFSQYLQLSEEQAGQHLEELKSNKQYQEEVY